MSLTRFIMVLAAAYALLLSPVSASAPQPPQETLKFFRDVRFDGKVPELASVRLDMVLYEALDGFSDMRLLGADFAEIPFRVSKQYTRREVVRRQACDSEVVSLKKLEDNRIELVIRNKSRDLVPRFLIFSIKSKDYDKQVTVHSGTQPESWGDPAPEQSIFDYSSIYGISSNTIKLPEGQGPYYKVLISNFSESRQEKRMELVEEKRDGADFSQITKKILKNDDLMINQIRLEAEIRSFKDDVQVTEQLSSEIISDAVVDKSTEIIVDVFRQPVTEISLKPRSKNFSRDCSIFTSDDREAWRRVFSGPISCISLQDLNSSQLECSLPESRARYLKVVINNLDAPPVEIAGVVCGGPVYKIEFIPPADTSRVRLYYGGNMPAPRYDVAEVIAKIANPTITELKLADEAANELFRGPSQPSFPESKTALYVVIVLMVILLGAALFKGIKKIDQTTEA